MKKVGLTVNARPVQVVADERRTVLLDVIREDLGLTGTKQSCDRKGQCGTCMVLVDGKAVLSCVTKVAAARRAPRSRRSRAWARRTAPTSSSRRSCWRAPSSAASASPGMIVTAEELLAANPDPTRAEVKRALRRNLCRCTGYVKIIDAVQLAGRFLRGEIAPADLMPAADAPPHRHLLPAARPRWPRPPARRSSAPTSACRARSRSPSSAAPTPTPGSAASTRPPRPRCPASPA